MTRADRFWLRSKPHPCELVRSGITLPGCRPLGRNRAFLLRLQFIPFKGQNVANPDGMHSLTVQAEDNQGFLTTKVIPLTTLNGISSASGSNGYSINELEGYRQ